MSIENAASCEDFGLDLTQPAVALWIQDGNEPTSFIDLILMASESSEDEGEVRDLVDTLFQSERLQLRDLREEHIPSL